MQDAVVDMDPISLIITSLDVKRGLPQHPAPPPAGRLGAHAAPLPGLPASVPRHPHARQKNQRGHHPMGPARQWSPARGRRRPIPLPTRHPTTGVLHPMHIPGRGTTSPTDHAPSVCGRHGGGDRNRTSTPADHPGPHQSHQSPPRSHHLPGGQPAAGTQRQICHHGTQRTAAAPPPRRPTHEPSKHGHLPGGQTSGHRRRGHPPAKPDTAADTDTSHSTHQGTLHPGPGIFPTSRAQRSYRIPGLAPNAPPTHAASGRYGSATSVDHPRPPAHIAACNGTRGITTILRRQYRSSSQQRVHSSHCSPPTSSHAQS